MTLCMKGDATPATQPPPVKGLARQKSKELEAESVRRAMSCSGCTSETRAREVSRKILHHQT